MWIRLPYVGNFGDNTKRNCFKKVQKCLKENVRFITYNETKKNAMFCSAKDRIPIHQKANVIYKVICPGSNQDYVGKSDRNLIMRLNEHAFCEDRPMHQHLSKCEHFAHTIDLLRLPDIDVSTIEMNKKQHFLTLLFLTFVSWKPAVTGPNSYF